VLPQSIFAKLNQITFYCVDVLKRAAMQLHCNVCVTVLQPPEISPTWIN